MITIFTPTYNRAYILPRLYNSLKNQTCKDFEWIIVDDGSTDNTQEIIKEYQKEQKQFPIYYIKQNNNGKHAAINRGVKEAKGEMFFIVDSDDALPVNAIKEIEQVSLSVKEKPIFAGVGGLKADIKNNKVLANGGKLQNIDCSMIDIRQKYGIKGDMAEVFKTEILKQYPFPVFEGEKFVNEAVIWNKIAEKHILRYVPEVLYLCEYLSDGLTKNIRKKCRNNPKGTICWLKGILNSPLFDLKTKLRVAVLYWRYLCTQKISYKEAVSWTYLFWPLGVAIYFYDKMKGK